MIQHAWKTAKAVFRAGLQIDRALSDDQNRRCLVQTGRLPEQKTGFAAAAGTEHGGIAAGGTGRYTEAGLTIALITAGTASLTYLLCASVGNRGSRQRKDTSR